MSIEHIAALAAFAFVSSITPGPNNLMLMASGANFGISRTVPHMLGVTLGFMLMIVLVGLGFIQIFTAFPQSYAVLKVAGIAYLLYLAWKIATAAPLEAGEGASNAKPFTLLQAMVFQWVNPKAWTMAVTGITAYSIPSEPMVSLLMVALVFGLVNLPSVSSWAAMGTQLRRFLNNPRKMRAFNICAALLLVASLYPVVFG